LQCPRKKSCSARKKNLAVAENFIPPPEEKKRPLQNWAGKQTLGTGGISLFLSL